MDSLTKDEIAYMRGKTWRTDPPDEYGFQHGQCIQEPRLSFVVRVPAKDVPEDRRWFVDNEPVSDIHEAIAVLTKAEA